jgi:hypothetical protein
MRPSYWVLLLVLLLTVSAGKLQAQARSLPREFAAMSGPLSQALSSDSTRRPFFLPRPGERTAYWVGFAAGVAISPFLWCESTGCGAVNKATTSLGLGVLGALSGLLLSRSF